MLLYIHTVLFERHSMEILPGILVVFGPLLIMGAALFAESLLSRRLPTRRNERFGSTKLG